MTGTVQCLQLFFLFGQENAATDSTSCVKNCYKKAVLKPLDNYESRNFLRHFVMDDAANSDAMLKRISKAFPGQHGTG